MNRSYAILSASLLQLSLLAQGPAHRDTGFEMIVPPPLVLLANTSQYLNMHLLPDGKVLFAGGIYNYSGDYSAIMRLNADGSFDEGWQGAAVGTIRAIAPAPGGKFILAGLFTSYNGVERAGVVRVDADGVLDESFNAAPDAFSSLGIFSVAVQPDGKVLVGGNFNDWAGSGRKGLVRLDTDGSVDETFSVGTGTSSNHNVQCIHVLPNGSILISGTFNNFNGSPRRLARLNADGSVDFAFNHNITSGDVPRFAVMPDGRIVNGGRMRRLLPDGADDPTFQGHGELQNVAAVEVYPDGRILAGGIFSAAAGQPAQRFVRLNADGTHDGGFDTAQGFDGAVLGIKLDADGRIYVCHYSTEYNGEDLRHFHSQSSFNHKFVIRLHGDGMPISVDEIQAPDMALFPNPARDHITVRTVDQRVDRVRLLAMDGRVVMVMAGGPMQDVIVPMNDVVPGSYLLEARTMNGHRLVRQVVKE